MRKGRNKWNYNRKIKKEGKRCYENYSKERLRSKEKERNIKIEENWKKERKKERKKESEGKEKIWQQCRYWGYQNKI